MRLYFPSKPIQPELSLSGHSFRMSECMILEVKKLSMSAPTQERYCFGDFELNSSRWTLCRSGVPVKIAPQPLKLLFVLIDRPGHVLSRDELRSRIWGGTTFVRVDQGLNYCVRRIRSPLTDDPPTPPSLRTPPQ